MNHQHLESAINELSARVTQQDIKIAALQKQLTDMQAAMSCDGDHMGFILDHMTKMNDAVSVKP